MKRDDLAYFALSVFWRAAIHRWPDPEDPTRTIKIELGPSNTELLRRYLLGEAALPPTVNLTFYVLTDRLSQAAIYLPGRTSKIGARWAMGLPVDSCSISSWVRRLIQRQVEFALCSRLNGLFGFATANIRHWKLLDTSIANVQRSRSRDDSNCYNPSSVQRLRLIYEQLEEAKAYLLRGSLLNLRLALILSDNTAELLLYDALEKTFDRDDWLRPLRMNYQLAGWRLDSAIAVKYPEEERAKAEKELEPMVQLAQHRLSTNILKNLGTGLNP